MSNFAALIATIQANIKTNGNEEITGAVLQDVLEAMVQALGTDAINNLETALGNEETARQNADGTLQNNIDAEALRAGTAEAGLDGRLDTIEAEIPSAASSSNKLTDKAFVKNLTDALQTAVNGIKSNIDNGYVYAGIATPSGTPVSGKVFYIATAAGTYTNFGGLVVTQGINILKYNGTAWSQEQLIGIDDVPTAGSPNLVMSGGVIHSLMVPSEKWEYQLKYVSDNLQIGDIITLNEVQGEWMTFKTFVPKGSTIFMHNLVTNVAANHIYVTDLGERVIEIIDKVEGVNTKHDYEYTATRDCFVVSSSSHNSAVYVKTSTPSQSVLTKVYTYANMSYQGFFRSTDAVAGKVLDMSFERIVYNESYRTEIVKVNRGAVINIINFPNIAECPYIIITDINKKIVSLISADTEYTCQEPGYIVFSTGSSSLLSITVDYNSPFHDNAVVYKDVDILYIQDKDCYYHKNNFVANNKCNLLETTPVQTPAQTLPQAIHPIIVYLKAGQSVLLFRSNLSDIDDNTFAVVDAETFECIERVSFDSAYPNKIVTYTEYIANKDVYILANGKGLTTTTSIKISQFAESYKSINECLAEIISRHTNLKLVEGGQWYPGYIGTDGAFNYTNSGKFMVSVLFKIPEGSQQIQLANMLRVYNTGALDIAFYDEDMNFISGIGRPTTGYSTLIGGTIDTVAVPNNAVYYRLTQNASNFIVKTKVYAEHEQMYTLSNITKDACNLVILTRAAGFIEKGISPWSVSESIRCTPGTKVFFNFSEGYNEYVAQVVVYDKNGLMLSKLENSLGYIEIPDGAEFFRMSFNNGITLNANSNIIDCYCDKENGISLYNPSAKKVPNLLVLGDSYSRQQNWIRSLRQFVNIDTIVNLARGSATMKDQFTDRTQYPYTSRPQSGDNGSARRQNNLNTFCCQLALLDRLMEGTDLDAGETQLYTDPSTYPDLIIIQGGKNDAVESDVTINSYANIIRDKVTAYAKRSNEESPTQQSVCLVKSMDVVDRTTFIGAMYVLYETLHQKFPNAVIVFVNPSNLQYGNSDVWYDGTKSDAMDIASKILSVPVIDWNRHGRLSYIFDHITTGNGTQANPYIVNSPTELTSDMLHPNVKGAAYLGKVAAGFLNSYL